MHLKEIWRYPVKALAGEQQQAVEVNHRGLVGDRWFAIHTDDGRFACGKNGKRFSQHDEVFDFAAQTQADGQVTVTGRGGQWTPGQPELDAVLSSATGASAQVRPEGLTPHHDAMPVSIIGTASLEWCARELGVDAIPRRLRVNLVIETNEPFIEESWIGQQVSVGGVALDVIRRNRRCRVIDLDQNGAGSPTRWLKPLGDKRDAMIAVYAEVATPGQIRVGDQLSLRPGVEQ
ncbi:MAG TPA: MOSC domain-containing protein [Marmoricola sp.]|nr:MOSC domain-containing protein [Marmoricola sp.]